MDTMTPKKNLSLCNWFGFFFMVMMSFLLTLSVIGPHPVFAACTDSDGDGYAIEGGACGAVDCDDGDEDVYPGASERCNGKDDDCDGSTDEGFNVGDDCYLGSPCVTLSHIVCTVDGLDSYCPVPESGLATPVPEVPYTDTCHDDIDNDCDGDTDGDDSDCPATEQCNNWDDDFDGGTDEDFSYSGIAIGDPCTVGTGSCQRSGNVICNETENGGECSAVPASPGSENTPGVGNCTDGEDNDCDGLSDLADTSCQEPEKCDEMDNDGDGLVDEDFVSAPHNLGQPCTEGVGACAASGVYICNPDKTTTVCSATGQLADTEGPTGETCSDGIDNDCDTLIDELDPGCGSVSLTAVCALPYLRGEPRNDCTGWHEIHFSALNATPSAVITAELLAVDLESNIIASTSVEDGDAAHLASRIDPEDYKFSSKTNVKGTRHEVFAPVPLLRVTVKDGLNAVQAYCSNIPYTKVIEPSGNVVSESEGDVTPVLAAIPLVDPSTISVKVDGVYILAELGIDPTTCTSSSPCSGTVSSGPLAGVSVSDLVIGVSPVGTLGFNTLAMKLSHLGCGGHIVVVEGDQLPGSFPMYATPDCNEDDLKDKGTSNGFAVEISNPTEGAVTSTVPTPVQGRACSGRDIAGVRINGKNLDVEGNVAFTPGDEEDSGDLYEYLIDTTLPQTDLASELTTGQAQIGTFDAGSNRLIAEVTDDLGNRTFETLIFAVGDVAGPSLSVLSEAVKAELDGVVKAIAGDKIKAFLESTETEVENAFVVGLEPSALQKVFNKMCDNAGVEFVDEVTANILAVEPIIKHPSGGCSCDPPVKIWISDVYADPNQISCPVTFVTDKIDIVVNLPDLFIEARAYGWCKTTGLLGECWAETIVDMTSTTTIKNTNLSFSITEGQLKGLPGTEPVYVAGTTEVHHVGGSDVNCVAAACNWAIEGLVSLLTFGTVDLDLTPHIDVSDEVNFNKAIGASEPDPFELAALKVDEEEVQDFGQVLRGDLDEVEITPNGLRATLKGTFSTLSIDPEIESTPGAALTPAQPPLIHPSAAGEVYLALADDTFNQLFAGLTASGALKTNCQATSLTFADLWPGDCEALTVEDKPFVTALWQGACHGYKGEDCNNIPVPDGQPLVAAAEKNACTTAQTNLASLNISSATPLLLCVKQVNPPNFLIKDDNATSPVETVLRLNDLSVAVVLDRNNNGFDGTQLSSIAKCLDPSAQTATASDCLGFAMCLDLDLLTEMQFQTCADGKPGFQTKFNNILVTDKVAGMVCGGLPPAGDDLLAEVSADSDPVNIDLTGNVENFTPPICAEGLDLGGFVQGLSTGSLKLISIDSAQGLGSPFQDYLGITGDVQP